MSRLLELSTGCRLHFGLLELAEGEPNRYGGLGLMLESPKLHLRLKSQADSAPHKVAPSVEIERRIQIAQSHALSAWQTRHDHDRSSILIPGIIEVLQCPPMHSGLGVGTQLGTAVAQLTALALQANQAGSAIACESSPAELAWLSGRGRRSAIGLHGFLYGGLVRDLGYESNTNTLASTHANSAMQRPTATQSVVMPDDWTVVLCCSTTSGDVHGQFEDQLIDRASTRANPNRERMLMLSSEALHAASSDDFSGFVRVLDEYMELASRLFASVQSGRYRDSQTAERVAAMQAAGLCGVGQSSWGPTVFGFAPNAQRAQAAADKLVQSLVPGTSHIVVTRPKASGAQWAMTSASGKQHAG